MENFTNTCQDARTLTCRPRDNLTFRQELERQCHVQMLILLVAAFIVGCLLMITVRTINKYWCTLRRRVSRPIPGTEVVRPVDCSVEERQFPILYAIVNSDTRKLPVYYLKEGQIEATITLLL